MAIVSWANASPISIQRNLSADERLYFVSDLHLGDGTPSDTFMNKDSLLIELIDKIAEEKAKLVIVGDAIDFHQAWSMSRVIRAHALLMRRLSELAAEHGVIYIWGNHDYDISLFRDLLRFDVCSSLTLDDKVLIQHGYEYDPFIGPNLEQTHLATQAHHLIERILNTWIRLPLENFYNFENRLAFWCFHKLVLAIKARDKLYRSIGKADWCGKTESYLQYWTMNQIANPAGIFYHASQFVQDSSYQHLLTGHSHLPGNVPLGDGKSYINTGSWTFSSAQYAIWDGERFTVKDYITQREYTDQAYKPLIEHRFSHMDFLAWWRENYLGWLKFRVGEVGRFKQPELPNMETN
ncbi:MAG: metallophosphoesterase [Myxococcota bacterium]